MKSRMLIEMMSALSLVLLTIMATATYGQGKMGMSMGDMGGMESGSDAAMRPSLSYTEGDKPYRATRVRSFRYVYQSFRPKELTYVSSNGDMGGGMGMDMGGMSSGMPGGSYGGGGYSGGPAAYPGGIGDGSYPGAAGGGSAGYGTSNSEPASERMTIKIHAYMFDKEKVNDRTHIELMIEQPNELGMAGMGGPGGMPGGYGAGGYGAGGMSDGGMSSGMPGGMPSSPSRMKPMASLGAPKTKASSRLSQSEINLVTDIICQAIWKADVVKALFASKGQGDSAAENEKLLKLLLAEQYDTQLARQEMEAESIKRRLELLVDELKRRKLAKDRVVDVQLGRLILDAQGLLNNDR